jgi:DNA-binding PadR family transcriptional regulator
MTGGKRNMKSILNQLFPSLSSREVESAGDSILRRLRAEAAQEIEEFRFRPDIRLKAEALKPVDVFALTAVWLLRGEGYCLTILHKVEELTSKSWSPGAVYFSLDVMEMQGLISYRDVQDGEYLRRFFTITETGIRVLAHVSPAQRAIEKLGHFA